MNYQTSFTYIPCQTCTAKIHCEQCADTVTQSLLQISGVTNAEVDMVKKQASVESSLDPDDLDEYLEDLGLFPG